MEKIDQLSKREWEVVNLLLEGKSNKMIAAVLGISDRTVEFHLKNIYLKCQVRSRVELILKLGKPTGFTRIKKQGSSTVAKPGENAENRERPSLPADWGTSLRENFFMTGKELEMENILGSKHVPVGVATAIATGLTWIALLAKFGHMPAEDIKMWIIPEIAIWIMIGLVVGLNGKRNGNRLKKVCFGSLAGTGISPFAVLPLMGFVVLPIGKSIEWLGLINLSSMPREVASNLAIAAMLILWLLVGTTVGSLLLFITINKQASNFNHPPTLEQHT
ncbi:MAG TPA: helix-turn-helix transcriptional regulator [Anaerolineales bacterium]|jgi:DNA-binding CsgD family transcriptional regulator